MAGEGSDLLQFAETVIEPETFTAGSDAASGVFDAMGAAGGAGAAALPAATPSSFWSDLVGGIGKSFTASPLQSFAQALGIGSTGLNIANQFSLGRQTQQATKRVEQAQKQATAAAAPAVAFGTETLEAAKAGKLPAPMQAAVEQWTQQAKAAIRQKYASMGLTNSTAIQGEESKIDLMAQSMIAELLQQQQGTALQGLQTGVSAAVGGGQLAQQQQQMLASLIERSNQQLGQLGASS